MAVTAKLAKILRQKPATYRLHARVCDVAGRFVSALTIAKTAGLHRFQSFRFQNCHALQAAVVQQCARELAHVGRCGRQPARRGNLRNLLDRLLDKTTGFIAHAFD